MTNQELDIAIAETIFNHKVVKKTWNKGKSYSLSLGEPNYYDSQGETSLYNPLPNYSQDITSAWEVVEELRTVSKVFCLSTVVDYSQDTKLLWIAKWEMNDPDYRFVFATGEDVCRVICEAALRAVEAK